MNRAVALVAGPLIVLGALVLPYVLLWSRLPEPLATHWGLNGQPNGYLPKVVALSLAAVLWIFIAGAAWLSSRSEGSMPPATTMYLIGGILIAATASILWANLGAAHWSAAKELDPFVALAVVLAPACAGGLAGRWIEARVGASNQEPTSPVPLQLGESERALWWGRASNPWLLTILLAASAYLFFSRGQPDGSWVFATMSLVLVILALHYSTVHVAVAGDRITIELGPWRWPRKTLLLSDVGDVEVSKIQPLRYGGWGYRRCGPRCRAYVIRRGDALVVKRSDGATTMVTVDGAKDAAALIAGLRERSGS